MTALIYVVDQLGIPHWSSLPPDAVEWLLPISETETAYQTSGGLKLWTACSKISSQAERTGGFGLQSKVCSNINVLCSPVFNLNF